jgi:hypothetical protein
MKITLISFFTLITIGAVAQDHLQTPYEKNGRHYTATYEEAIYYYHKLDSIYDEVKLIPYGKTDAGYPLHLVVISKDKTFNPRQIHKQGKAVVLVMNGIHPGEPEGIDASMMLARDLVKDDQLADILTNTVVCLMPIYNIGGALKRNSHSRANQNGPEEYGFRGNARNLDLNRDFIKNDAMNSRTFAKIRGLWNPHIFIDNHTSNGADYPYTLTVISTQKDKLNKSLAGYMATLNERIAQITEANRYEMYPYVYPLKGPPDNGIVAFLETPRYSTGYMALFNTIGYTVETHMLKPYRDRVNATYEFMRATIKAANSDHTALVKAKTEADRQTTNQGFFPIEWQLDSSKHKMIVYKGYEAKLKTSDVTGKDRLFYDQSAPFEKEIKFYDTYRPITSVRKPFVYIIPQGWLEVKLLLQLNGVRLKELAEDTVLTVETYYIKEYTMSKRPYEGHFMHRDVVVESKTMDVQFRKGDLVVYVNQVTNRYIVETLEPHAHDSYFVWNFFDEILNQKEWYSAYVFDDRAAELLESDPELKEKFEKRKAADAEFAKSPSAQLRFIYLNSPHYEGDVHLRYPVGRLMEPQQLPLK